ncbi:TonB family protein [Mesorhizobium sp.]|uniref:TonB family protein n=1 Tax=Mesorhizobium sp. TaxID=1871066 RepID=UPI0035677A11
MQDINPLPDAGSVLAIVPAEAPLRASEWNRKWTAAVVISCLLHAAVAAAFLISPAGRSDSRDAAQSEGSNKVGDKVAGSSLDKDPAAINVKLVSNPQPIKPQPARPAKPAPPTDPSQPERKPVKQPSRPFQEAAGQPEAIKQPAAAPDILPAATRRHADQSVAAKSEPPARPAIQAESSQMPAVPDRPPIPGARPTPAAAPSTAANEKSGMADGQDRVAQADSKGKREKDAGSAAEDSYRGDVIRRLGRVYRAVPPSLQATARSNTVVTFVIGRQGNIDELRVVESSGSETFDQIVLGFVRKAAPFPPIPPKVGESLEFTGAIGPF